MRRTEGYLTGIKLVGLHIQEVGGGGGVRGWAWWSFTLWPSTLLVFIFIINPQERLENFAVNL